MRPRTIRFGKTELALAAVSLFLLAMIFNSSAQAAWYQNKQGKSPVGASLDLDEVTVWASPNWTKQPWGKDGKRRGWRLRHQPQGNNDDSSGLSINFVAEPRTRSSLEKLLLEQDRILRVMRKNYPENFLVQNMPVAGERVLIMRFYNRGDTIFLVLPRTGKKLYEVYIWVRGKVEALPGPAQEILDTLTLPGQPPYQPPLAEAGPQAQPSPPPPPAPPKPQQPAVPPDPPKAGPVLDGVCYLADKADSGRVLDLRLGMPLAQVERNHRVIPYTRGSYRLWESKDPCLACYEYELAPKGFEKKKTNFAVVFEVDEKNPAKPMTRIEAKIVCGEGLELSRRLFGWYAEKYGPPDKKTNEMDGTMNLGSKVVSAEFWHTWHLKGKGSNPSIGLEIKRRNDFAYYTVTLQAE